MDAPVAAQAKEDTPPVNGAMKQHIDDDAPANGAAKPRKRVTFVLPSRSAGSSRCVVIPTAALRAPEEDAAAEKQRKLLEWRETFQREAARKQAEYQQEAWEREVAREERAVA